MHGGRHAQRMGLVQGHDDRHFALVLVAAVDEHGVGASGQAGGSVFAAGADVLTAYLQDAVGGVGADDGAEKGDGLGSGRGALRHGNCFLHKIIYLYLKCYTLLKKKGTEPPRSRRAEVVIPRFF